MMEELFGAVREQNTLHISDVAVFFELDRPIVSVFMVIVTELGVNEESPRVLFPPTTLVNFPVTILVEIPSVLRMTIKTQMT